MIIDYSYYLTLVYFLSITKCFCVSKKVYKSIRPSVVSIFKKKIFKYLKLTTKSTHFLSIVHADH